MNDARFDFDEDFHKVINAPLRRAVPSGSRVTWEVAGCRLTSRKKLASATYARRSVCASSGCVVHATRSTCWLLRGLLLRRTATRPPTSSRGAAPLCREQCPNLHRYIPELMPMCTYFQRDGVCNKPNCEFLHVDNSASQKVRTM